MACALALALNVTTSAVSLVPLESKVPIPCLHTKRRCQTQQFRLHQNLDFESPSYPEEEGLTSKLVALPIRRNTCNLSCPFVKSVVSISATPAPINNSCGAKLRLDSLNSMELDANFNDRRLTSFKLAITAKHAHKNAIAVCLIRFGVIARPGDCEAPITQCSNARSSFPLKLLVSARFGPSTILPSLSNC